MQEEEIVEFGKEESQTKSLQLTLSSTQLVLISSVLLARDLQASQRRCRVEKTRRQCLKRGVNIPVVFIRIATWFASWQILLYFF